jgi:hypothetical protein
MAINIRETLLALFVRGNAALLVRGLEFFTGFLCISLISPRREKNEDNGGGGVIPFSLLMSQNDVWAQRSGAWLSQTHYSLVNKD